MPKSTALIPSLPSLPSVPSIPEINALHQEATALAGQARALADSAKNKAILLGLKLTVLKEATPHGQWEALFASGPRRVGKANDARVQYFDFSQDSARRYIAVAANLMSQRLTSEQSAALMQLASQPQTVDLTPDEITFLDEVTPEKSLRQLYLNLGIISPTIKEARAMAAVEDNACRLPDAPKEKRAASPSAALQLKKAAARVHWFGTQAAGMVNPASLLHRLMDEARNPALNHLHLLHRADLSEIEITLKDLLKITKALLAESTKS